MKKREGRKRAKWNRRLLPQIGMIIAGIFILSIGVSAFIQVKGSMSTYLEAKQEMLRPIAYRLSGQLATLKNLGWFLDVWEEIPDIQYLFLTTSSGDPHLEEFYSYFTMEDDNGFVMPVYDPDELESYEHRKKVLLAAFVYGMIQEDQIVLAYQQASVTSYLLDVREGKWGTGLLVMDDVFTKLDYSDPSSIDWDFENHLGEDYSEYLNSIHGIKEIISGGTPQFVRYESPKNGEYDYLYITPIVEDGKTLAVQITSYDWSEYHSSLVKKQILISVFSGLALLVAAVLLLYFITRSAIRPLGKIQQGVRAYMQNKDSGEVAERMSKIRQKNEFGILADDVSQMAVEMERYNRENAYLTGERERVAAELSLAASIQLGVLPVDFPEAPDYELYATMTPAKEVGGDLYDFFDIDETHLGLVIGDVSGKGVPASLFMMIAKLLIREYAVSGGSPAEVLAKANKTLCENNRNDMFVTAWFGILDRTTGRIVASSAGHEFPILRDPDGEYRLIKDKHGFVLGGMDISRYKEYEMQLQPGGTLLVYTDGAPEATDAQDELFGTDRMLEALNQHVEDRPKDLVEHLKQAIEAFVGDAPQFDDLTMLCVQWNGLS